ncbi:MAG TPA: TetR/AcrR family transcriptional regulator [Solirubrobacterales bacterium]|nr:TetR/AcrR family transcriptional regulator [Solirubrobacterales bacterium]
MPGEATIPRPGPGRPPSGARERILDGALEVLERDGYAGLTTAKVAAASGQNKALIGYHFGSKQGLVAAVAREVADGITREVLRGLGEPAGAGELVAGTLAGIWRVLDRDEGLARVYFDLASQASVELEVQAIMAEMKAGFRRVLVDLLGGLVAPPPRRRREAIAIFLIAGIEGLALERLDRGETPELRAARRLWIETAARAVSGPDR